MSDKWTAAQLEPHLNSDFKIQIADDQSIVLKLIEVERRPERPAETRIAPGGHKITVRTDPFSLIFLGPHEPILAQQLIRLTHPVLGHLDEWFIVPIAHLEDGIHYQVVFD
ncbi:MAG: hypothetical protein QNJ45_22170 [Ardenticatenaceae bacterium]|nr:hypothetical protein [Ardenticatenaceae bacterium]